MDAVGNFRVRGKRLLLLREFVETFDSATEQKAMVMRLWEGKLVSPDSAKLLIEHFHLENA